MYHNYAERQTRVNSVDKDQGLNCLPLHPAVLYATIGSNIASRKHAYIILTPLNPILI